MRVSPGDRVRILYLGDTWSFSQNKIILGWIQSEPRLSLFVVPCDLEVMTSIEATKFTRLYLPRNYRELNQSYDALVLNNISPRVIDPKVLEFFRRGIRDDGLGAYLVSFLFWGGMGQGTNDIQMWMAIPFYDVLPCDVDMKSDVLWNKGKVHYKVIRREPIFNMPGVERVDMFMHHGGDIIPRAGTVVHAVWRERGTPVLVSGRYGKGKTLELDQAWNDIPVPSLQGYRYFPDLIYNQVYFVAGLHPPADLELAHRVRQLFIDVQLRKKVTISALEFVELFGGNTLEVEKQLSQLDHEAGEAQGAYLKEDMAGAFKVLDHIMNTYPVIDQTLTRVKQRALLWIYLIEWLVITSTTMLVGIALWTLMVKRKLYREMNTTRFIGE